MTRVMTDCVITDMLRGNPAGIEIRSFHRQSLYVRFPMSFLFFLFLIFLCNKHRLSSLFSFGIARSVVRVFNRAIRKDRTLEFHRERFHRLSH